MKFKKLQILLYSFLLILLFQNPYINSLKLNEKYPKTLLLSSEKLFLVTENGFRLYDSTLKNQINYYNFPSDDRKITSLDEAALTSIAEFSDGIIIALAKKYLYIFNSEGVFQKEEDLTSILVNGFYYDLIAYKIESNDYYYIVSYYDSTGDNGPFSIKYCKFSTDSTTSISNPIYQITYTPINSNGNESGIQKCGLSCEIMNRNNKDVLTCFYQINEPPTLGVDSFDITDNPITKIDMDKIYSSNNQVSIIKSAISPDKKTAFICYTRYNTFGKCLQYNIDNNVFTEEIQYFTTCRDTPNYMNVYYFQKKNEYMFICTDQDNIKGFNVVKFNSNFEQISEINPQTTDYSYNGKCYNILSFNMIYLSSIDDYILINDCEGDGSIFSTGSINLELLFGNNNSYPIDEDIDLFYNKTTTVPIVANEETNIETEVETIEPTETDSNTEENIETSEIIESNNADSTNKQQTNNSVIFDESTQSKDEIINNFDNIIQDKDPEKSYVINGGDFTLIIKPVNEVIEECTVNIDFSECEKVLKEKNPEKEFRIMQINMENKKENCLTDQVEYKIYDEEGNEIDLSVCDEVEILIEYEIKNASLLNLEQISSFQDQGIDIFDIDNEFFNDICYSYSDNGSDSDMILSDRVADIYQNFSICGDGCEYESFNLEKISANCNCKVKQEVSSEPENGNFKSYIMSAFLDSNFGIIKCFKLVFSLKGKLKNAGFWVFGLMIMTHIPIYIFYFINGTTPVVKYIKKEMDDKGYQVNDKRKISKKKSITSRIESTSQNLDDKQDLPSAKLREHKKINNSNPPKKLNTSFSDDENMKKHKKIELTENIPKKNKHKKSVLSEIDKNNKHFHNKKSTKRVDSPDIGKKKIILSTFGKEHNRNEKRKHLRLSNFDTIETNNDSPLNYIHEELESPNKKNEKEKIKKKKSSENIKEIKEEFLESNKNIDKDKRKSKNAFNRKNNLVLEFESGDLLANSNNTLKKKIKKINKKKISNKKMSQNKKNHSSKFIKPTLSEEGKEKKFERNNKKITTQFPLILINASNSKNHQTLKSNYVIGNYDFEEAITNERRGFFRIFFIYLISKENVLNIIFFNPPLELKPIRLCVFIFSFACDFALNALFYLSDNISDKYHYTGAYRELYALVNNLTISLVSTVVSFILLFFFQSLTQSSKKIENLFREQENLLKNDKEYKVNNETIKEIKNNIDKIIKCLKVKIMTFIFFEVILMLFFFYYTTAFCQVYPSTQVSWILDCISSYVISLAITLLISFLCTSFYKLAIKYRIKILYKIILLFYSA